LEYFGTGELSGRGVGRGDNPNQKSVWGRGENSTSSLCTIWWNGTWNKEIKKT